MLLGSNGRVLEKGKSQKDRIRVRMYIGHVRKGKGKARRNQDWKKWETEIKAVLTSNLPAFITFIPGHFNSMDSDTKQHTTIGCQHAK